LEIIHAPFLGTWCCMQGTCATCWSSLF